MCIRDSANGGTGKNSVTAHLLMVGNGTSAFNTIAIGTSGQALLSGVLVLIQHLEILTEVHSNGYSN